MEAFLMSTHLTWIDPYVGKQSFPQGTAIEIEMILFFMWQILLLKSFQIFNLQSITILSGDEDVGHMDDPRTSEKTVKTELNN